MPLKVTLTDITLTFPRKKNYFIYTQLPSESGGTQWRSWLRHCATKLKVAGSIPVARCIGLTNLSPSCANLLKSESLKLEETSEPFAVRK